jgi:hypothetical protein
VKEWTIVDIKRALEWLVAIHSEGRRQQSQMAPPMRIAETRDYEIGIMPTIS